MPYFEKDPNKIRLNYARVKNLITDEQYERIKQYLESDEEEICNLGKETLKGIIKQSSQNEINTNN